MRRKVLLGIMVVCVMVFLAQAETGRKYTGELRAVTRVDTTHITQVQVQTAQELLAAAATGEHYVITGVIVSSTANTRVIFNDSGTTTDQGYGGYQTPSTGGTVIDRDIYLELASATAFYAVAFPTSCDLTIEYHTKR